MRQIAIFYKGRDNKVTLRLQKTGGNVDLGAVSKIVFDYGSGIIDSSVNPNAFVFGQSSIDLYFGRLSLGVGVYLMQIIVYSNDAPNGIAWGEKITVDLR